MTGCRRWAASKYVPFGPVAKALEVGILWSPLCMANELYSGCTDLRCPRDSHARHLGCFFPAYSDFGVILPGLECMFFALSIHHFRCSGCWNKAPSFLSGKEACQSDTSLWCRLALLDGHGPTTRALRSSFRKYKVLSVVDVPWRAYPAALPVQSNRLRIHLIIRNAYSPGLSEIYSPNNSARFERLGFLHRAWSPADKAMLCLVEFQACTAHMLLSKATTGLSTSESPCISSFLTWIPEWGTDKNRQFWVRLIFHTRMRASINDSSQ